MRTRLNFLNFFLISDPNSKEKFFSKQPTLLIELESVLSEEEDSDRMRGD